MPKVNSNIQTEDDNKLSPSNLLKNLGFSKESIAKTEIDENFLTEDTVSKTFEKQINIECEKRRKKDLICVMASKKRLKRLVQNLKSRLEEEEKAFYSWSQLGCSNIGEVQSFICQIKQQREASCQAVACLKADFECLKTQKKDMQCSIMTNQQEYKRWSEKVKRQRQTHRDEINELCQQQECLSDRLETLMKEEKNQVTNSSKESEDKRKGTEVLLKLKSQESKLKDCNQQEQKYLEKMKQSLLDLMKECECLKEEQEKVKCCFAELFGQVKCHRKQLDSLCQQKEGLQDTVHELEKEIIECQGKQKEITNTMNGDDMKNLRNEFTDVEKTVKALKDQYCDIQACQQERKLVLEKLKKDIIFTQMAIKDQMQCKDFESSIIKSTSEAICDIECKDL